MSKEAKWPIADLNINEEESLSQERPPSDQGFLWKDFEKDKFEARRKNLAERFIVPPFSVLDTRQGYWQEGKRLWLELGIKSEKGREENLLHMSKLVQSKGFSGTSVFDPVLCEVIYKWFCPPGGKILDPFAGGSVRGIIAEYLGYKYTGIELRGEQIESNREQAQQIKLSPCWVEGDSEEKLDVLSFSRFNLLFSCPPYFNLEVYSDLPGELSAIKRYEDFLIKYANIVGKASKLLKPESIACFVVANIRDRKSGFYYPLVSDTVRIFEEKGMGFYNEAILISSPGSLPIRVGRMFEASRKLGKMHQNILIFKKGKERKGK